jgi:hypothetical protein
VVFCRTARVIALAHNFVNGFQVSFHEDLTRGSGGRILSAPAAGFHVREDVAPFGETFQMQPGSFLESG